MVAPDSVFLLAELLLEFAAGPLVEAGCLGGAGLALPFAAFGLDLPGFHIFDMLFLPPSLDLMVRSKQIQPKISEQEVCLA